MKLQEWKCINAEGACISTIYTPLDWQGKARQFDSNIIEASKKLIFLYGKNSCFIKLKKGKIITRVENANI
jgi:hypothetical protein